MQQLTGKVVAITGGARGIGAATARALIAAGARVGIGDLDADVAETTAAELGSNAMATRLDVTDPESFRAFLDLVEGTFGPIDVLVNNAGIMLVGEFVKEEDRAAQLMMDVNVHGVLNGCKAVLPRFQERSDGHIVNVASMAGKVPVPHLVTYVATKHAVVGLSDALRVELRDQGIQVSTIMPNVVNTRLGQGAAKNLIRAVEPQHVADVIVRVIATRKNEATVPRWLGGLTASTAWLPSRARQTVARWSGAERTMIEADHEARRGYEDNVLRRG